MNVGIISMQRVCNKGSFLQAYGLKKMVESLGHHVEFVDYEVGKPLFGNSADKRQYHILKVRNSFINLFIRCKWLRMFLPDSYRQIVIERDEYKKFIAKHLGVTNKMKYRTSVDALIIGSDEVFNCTQINPKVGYSPEIFGVNNKARKLLSYAASFGNTTYQKLADFGKVDELKGFLTAFDSISVRDRNSSAVVEKLLGSKPDVNLDPVLMYDYMPTIKDEQIRKNYIIVYAYRSRITPEEAREIKAFAKRVGKKLISVSGQMDFCDEHLSLNPFECLNLYRHADYVITDTFHGTIFSIINRKKFVTLIRESKGSSYGNQEKLQDLLDRMGLQARSFSNGKDNLYERLSADIDYDKVFDVIDTERKHTMEYLSTNLGL